MGKHSDWRKLVKKLRRKRIRQVKAKQIYAIEKAELQRLEKHPEYVSWLKNQEEAQTFLEQEEARRATKQEAEWIRIEEEAHKQWLELQAKLKIAQEERAKQNALIRLEWEKEQQKLKQLKEQKEREEREKHEQQEFLNRQIEDFIINGGPVPEKLNVSLETNPNKEICPFFKKTGACRFRDSCSRNHIRPGISEILLIPNFYSHYSLDQTENEYGCDSFLEYETHEMYEHFCDFFFDIVPELEKYGHIKQLKVCCNKEHHLRGNVYVEYSSSRESIGCYKALQGRWYGGKQLNVEFCLIESWKSAVCGVYFKNKCPKGSACNFLHIFRNPNGLYNNSNKTYEKNDGDSEFSDARHWRWSESPENLGINDNEFERRKKRHSVKNRYNEKETDIKKRRRDNYKRHSSRKSTSSGSRRKKYKKSNHSSSLKRNSRSRSR